MNGQPLYTAAVIGLFVALGAWTAYAVWTDHARDRRLREQELAEARLKAAYDHHRRQANLFAENRIDALADPAHPYWSDWELEVSR